MAIQIESIREQADQEITLLTNGGDVTIRLRFHNVIEAWTMDVVHATGEVYGVRLAAGIDLVRGSNFPVSFVVQDTSGDGIDPYQLTDFTNGRCLLWMLTVDDMEDARGVEVPVA